MGESHAHTGRTSNGTELSSPVRILVVDDHPENLLAVRATLSVPDYRLVEAHSGEEALKKLLHDDDFALVLLDVRMPGIDGFEVAELMRRRERTRFVPIVFLSAEAIDIASTYQGYEAGAVDYLVKPLDPVVLRAKVAAFAELHQQRERIRRQGELLARSEAKNYELRLAQVQLEGERREKAALAASLRMRDDFLALASHELNTPLTPLLTSIQSLLASVRTGRFQPNDAVRSLELAQRQIRRLARLVSQLLDVARIESGHLAIARREVDLGDIVEAVVEGHAEEAKQGGTQIVVSITGPARGLWDRGRLELVVGNLLSNAIKFGGRKTIEVTVEPTSQGARLVVCDQGIGIGSEQIAHIFERFSRAESVRNYGGLGLGLYVVRRLVEAHGGKVRVESKLGAGSTFTVDLPADGGARAEQHDTAASATS
jgi:signal transduction histidine kinase